MEVSDRVVRAIDAIVELLAKLRLESMFVGSIARAAWLGGTVDGGPVDVVAVMQPQQKNQVAMMASNRGFRVDRGEVEQAEELDLIPLHYEDVRVHVLVASNALYAKMVGAARPVSLADRELKVAAPEDLALLLTLSEDFEAVQKLMADPGFARDRYNEMLMAIGLRSVAAGASPAAGRPRAAAPTRDSGKHR
jgi:hypothetical protein